MKRHNSPGSILVRRDAVLAFVLATLSIVAALIGYDSSVPVAAGAAFLVTIIASWPLIAHFGLISGPVAFLGLLACFHLGMVVPVRVLGTEMPHVSRSWLFYPELARAISMYALAVGAFGAGTLCFRSGPRDGDEAVGIPPRSVSTLWLIVFLVSVVGYLFYGIGRGLLLAETRDLYLRLRDSGEASWFGIFREFIVIGGAFAIAFARERWRIWAVFGIAVVTFLPMFLLGQRGFFIVTIAAFVVMIHLKGVRIPKVAAAAGALALFLLIPFIRNRRGGIPSFAEGVWDPFYEMGQNIRVVLFTIDAVETGMWPLQYGATFVDALKRIVPNIYGLRNVVGGHREASPSYIITELYNPGGAGLGMSFVAEAYVNFSYVGVLLVFFLLGYGLAYGQWARRRSPYHLAVYGAALGSVLWLARGDSFAVSRPLAWAALSALASYLLVVVIRRKGRVRGVVLLEGGAIGRGGLPAPAKLAEVDETVGHPGGSRMRSPGGSIDV